MKAMKPGITLAPPIRFLTWTTLFLFLITNFSCHVFKKKRKYRARYSSASYGPTIKFKRKASKQYYHYSRPATSSNSSTSGGSVGKFSGNASKHVYANRYKFAPANKPSAVAGTLTAGELNDFGKWKLWEDLTKTSLHSQVRLWKLKPMERYTIQVTNPDAKPILDCSVQLLDGDENIIWEAKTDNTGKAELWANCFTTDKQSTKATSMRATFGEATYILPGLLKFHDGINQLTIPAICKIPDKLDIAFMVDATGSMGDEINYLKAELSDIAEKITKQHDDLDLAMASIFYRCEDNSYTTKRSDFSSDISKTVNFIQNQSADEGGTEAVEIALDEAINKLRWRPDARARLLFIVLDESPGMTDKIIEKLHKSIASAARKGIRIIPLVTSGVYYYDQNKSLEYLMRAMALATNGTYVFLTDHSGVGNNHADPTTDEYDVELVNDLLLRLVNQFTFVPECEPKDGEPTVSDTVYVFNKKVIEHVVLNRDLRSKHSEKETASTETTVVDPALVVIETIAEVVEEEPSMEENYESEIDGENAEEIDEEDEEEEVIEPEWRSFKIYPNPSSGLIYVEIDGDLKELYLADVTGKLLQRIMVSGERKVKIDLTHLPSGSYLIQGMYEEEWLSGKVILTR